MWDRDTFVRGILDDSPNVRASTGVSRTAAGVSPTQSAEYCSMSTVLDISPADTSQPVLQSSQPVATLAPESLASVDNTAATPANVSSGDSGGGAARYRRAAPPPCGPAQPRSLLSPASPSQPRGGPQQQQQPSQQQQLTGGLRSDDPPQLPPGPPGPRRTEQSGLVTAASPGYGGGASPPPGGTPPAQQKRTSDDSPGSSSSPTSMSRQPQVANVQFSLKNSGGGGGGAGALSQQPSDDALTLMREVERTTPRGALLADVGSNAAAAPSKGGGRGAESRSNIPGADGGPDLQDTAIGEMISASYRATNTGGTSGTVDGGVAGEDEKASEGAKMMFRFALLFINFTFVVASMLMIMAGIVSRGNSAVSLCDGCANVTLSSMILGGVMWLFALLAFNWIRERNILFLLLYVALVLCIIIANIAILIYSIWLASTTGVGEIDSSNSTLETWVSEVTRNNSLEIAELCNLQHQNNCSGFFFGCCSHECWPNASSPPWWVSEVCPDCPEAPATTTCSEAMWVVTLRRNIGGFTVMLGFALVLSLTGIALAFFARKISQSL